jgi:hypothetical protein
MSKAQLVITAVVLEGRSESQVAYAIVSHCGATVLAVPTMPTVVSNSHRFLRDVESCRPRVI